MDLPCWNIDQSEGTRASRVAGMLGQATELIFSVTFFSTTDVSEEMDSTRMQTLFGPQSVDATTGEVAGSVVVEKDGMVTISWNNSKSWVSPKQLEHYKVTVDVA